MFGLNRHGNTTLIAVMVLAAMMSGMYYLSSSIIHERKVALALRKNIGANIALRSVTDYIKYGTRKGWCFDENMLPELPEVCAGSFTQPRSTFRLLMPASFEESLRLIASQDPLAMPPLPAGDLHLNQFSFITEIDKISALHPLAIILSDLKTTSIKFVRIQMTRIDDQTLPSSGDEVFIESLVEFLGADSTVLRDGSEYFREKTKYVAHPREVNSFALMVAGNMYLGTSSPPKGVGNFFVPQVPLSSKYEGLVFDSSVYVNGNIQLNEKAYTPVRFNQAVVLGNGQILNNNGKPFSIGQSLGSKKYWSDLNIFGGFINGFDTDSKRDTGLDTLAGLTPSATLNNALIQKCISLIRARSTLKLTDGTYLTARKLTTSESQFLNRYSFVTSPNGVQDIFFPQKISNSQVPPTVSTDGRIRYDKSAFDLNSQSLIFWADFTWDGQTIRLPLLEDSVGLGIPVVVKFSPYTAQDVTNAESGYNDAQKNYQTLKTEYDLYLKTEPPKMIPPSVTVNPAWTTWEAKRVTMESDLNAAFKVADNLKNDWLKKKDYYDNPAAIRLVTEKSELFGRRQSPFRDVTVASINREKFVKQKNDFRMGPYEFIAPNFLRLEAMDYSASGGVSRRKPASEFNVAYHKFGVDAVGVLVNNTLYKKDLTTLIIGAGADESFDYETFAEACNSGSPSGGGVNLDAFQPAGWSTSFTTMSEDSWNFASPDDAPKGTYVDQIFSSDSAVFDAGAIRKVCAIKSTARFVSGFYVCQQLIIEDRTDPLTIVGTFVVTRDFSIHPHALHAGIHWSNMHSTTAVRQLKSKSILARMDGSSCSSIAKPYWHPDPGISTVADRVRCSSEFLLQGKNPPRWTSIDPDCGRLNSTDTVTKCMKRIRNFNLIQLERVYGF